MVVSAPFGRNLTQWLRPRERGSVFASSHASRCAEVVSSNIVKAPAILFASLGLLKRPNRHFAVLGALDGAIARALGRSKTTISRELQRNALPSGGYSPLHAAGAYQLRRRREAILEREAALRLFVGDRLAEGWTPEQISGWLKSGNEPRLRAIGCETIYAFIYRTGQKAEALWRYLTRRHKRRRPRRARASRDTIKDRASIHDRPKTIEAAARPATGRATSSSANAHGLCSSCTSVSHGHARRAAHRENRRRNHLSDARGVRLHRSSSAKIHHFRQRHRLRPARPAQDHARHDDLVLRRLCLMTSRFPPEKMRAPLLARGIFCTREALLAGPTDLRNPKRW